jgi:cerevisin
MKGVITLALAAAASASPVVLFDTFTSQGEAIPIHSAQNAVEIPDSYMIMFKDHVTQELAADHHDWVHSVHTKSQDIKSELKKRSQEPFLDEFYAGLKHTYNIAGSLLGYSGHFDEATIEAIRRHPDVSHQPL